MTSIFENAPRRYFRLPGGGVQDLVSINVRQPGWAQKVADAERMGFEELVPVTRLREFAERVDEGWSAPDEFAAAEHIKGGLIELLDELSAGTYAPDPG